MTTDLLDRLSLGFGVILVSRSNAHWKRSKKLLPQYSCFLLQVTKATTVTTLTSMQSAQKQAILSIKILQFQPIEDILVAVAPLSTERYRTTCVAGWLDLNFAKIRTSTIRNDSFPILLHIRYLGTNPHRHYW